MKQFIKLTILLLAAFMLFSLVSCHPERRVMGNPELFREVGEQWVEFHPCYTIPSVIIKRGDTVIHESIKTDTLVKYDSTYRIIEKQVIKTITKDKFRVDTITISKPDLRLQTQYKEQLIEAKTQLSAAVVEAADWKTKALGTWVFGGILLLLLLYLLVKPKFL